MRQRSNRRSHKTQITESDIRQMIREEIFMLNEDTYNSNDVMEYLEKELSEFEVDIFWEGDMDNRALIVIENFFGSERLLRNVIEGIDRHTKGILDNYRIYEDGAEIYLADTF